MLMVIDSIAKRTTICNPMSTTSAEPYDYELFLQAAEDRRKRALEMRQQGKTYAEIGADMNVTRQRAFRMVQRAKEALIDAK